MDYLVRALSDEADVRVIAARTSELVEEARRRHQTWPTATAALGRALTAVGLLGATLKGDDTITLRIDGNGPLGRIIADSDANGHVRGYVHHPQTDLPPTPAGKLDVGTAVGRDGFLYIIRDLGLKEPFTGSVPLVSGEIAEDLTYYFTQSEQTPSSVGLGVLVNPDGGVRTAGGFLMQVMPGASDTILDRLEENLRQFSSVSHLIDQGKTPEDLVKILFHGLSYHLAEKKELSFVCRCNKEKLARVLISLGKDDLDHLIEQGHAELVCHFCGEKYLFSREELRELRNHAVGQ